MSAFLVLIGELFSVPNHLHVLGILAFILSIGMVGFPFSFRWLIGKREDDMKAFSYLPPVPSLIDEAKVIQETDLNQNSKSNPNSPAWRVFIGPTVCLRCGHTNHLTKHCVACGDNL